jgi:hypothetical protein
MPNFESRSVYFTEERRSELLHKLDPDAFDSQVIQLLHLWEEKEKKLQAILH